MQKKRNTKFSIADYIIILICISGSVLLGAAFSKEYNRTLVKLNEEPVGTIIFKRNTAQRKFNDREIWDRLKQATPVYNGDTIRTVERSEAVIVFNDEITRLDLDEGTLIQIFHDDRNGSRINFFSGNLEVVSGAKGMVILARGVEIIIEGQANLKQTDEGFGLSVLEGHASFDGKEVAAGEILILDSNGNISTSPAIAMTSFGPSARVLGAPGTAVPVVFSWNTSHFDADSYVIVEVTLDRGHRYIVETKDVSGAVSVSIPLENGFYWWRAYAANSGSREPASGIYPSGNLEVIPVTVTTLFSPALAEKIIYPDISRVPLSWSASENAAYLVEISANADMSAPVVSRRVERNSVSHTGLESGHWFWRVTPVFPARYIGSAPPSAVSDFFVIQGHPMPTEPVLTLPANNGTINLDSGGRRLLWAFDSAAASWDVELAENPDMTNPVVKQNVVSNFFPLPQEVLQDGKTWYWRISALGSAQGGIMGALPVFSATRNFTVRSVPPAVETVPTALPPALPQVTKSSPVEAVPAALPLVTEPLVTESPVVELPPALSQVPELSSEPVIQEELVRPALAVTEQLPSEPPSVPPFSAQPPPAQALPAQTGISGNLLRLASSSSRTVSRTVPAAGHSYTTEQLANIMSINFSWRGEASEYRFAVFRTDGVGIISPTTVTASRYTLTNPAGILPEGNYVWQVFEKDRRGNWDLPSSSNSFSVIKPKS